MIKIKSFASVAIIALATTVLTVFNSGCNKDKELVPDVETAKTEMLVFKDYEEYAQTLQKVISFDHNELKAWEEARGFKSFGRMCEEVYMSIDFDKFNTFEEMYQTVIQNSDYLTLVQEEDEYSLEHPLYNKPERYLINSKKMYQIEGVVYKVFERHLAFAEESNIKLLETIDETSIASKIKDSRVTIIENQNTLSSKDIQNNCGAGEIDDSKSWGVYRIKLTIGIHQPYNPGGISLGRFYFVARPYRKSLGVWRWTGKRTIAADINFANDHMTPNGWDRIIGRHYYAPRNAWKIEDEAANYVWGYTQNQPLYIHFGAYDCWASSDMVPNDVVLKCGNLL